MATKAKKRPPRAKKAKQGFLPEMEPPSHKDIDQQADLYFEAKTERMRLTEEETNQKQALLTAMKKHELTHYETPDGLLVDVEAEEAIKCKRKKIKAETNGDGAEE